MADQFDTEALFTAIGLDRILAGKPKMFKKDITRAAELPQEIRRRLGHFMATTEFEPAKEFPDFDYDKTLEVVSAGQTKPQTNALMLAVPDNELATDIGLKAKEILDWANGILPREHQPDVAGEMRLETPDSHSIADFRRVWNVARDPMTVIDDLEDGSLSQDEVGALATIYPAIYSDMVQAVQETLGSLRARKGINWDPNPQKVQLLATLQGKDAVDVELSAAVQKVYAQMDQQQASAPPPKPPSGGKLANPELTPGQKAGSGSQIPA